MIDLDKIEKLMALMAQYGVDVVQAEAGNERVSLAKNAGEARFFERSDGAASRIHGGSSSTPTEVHAQGGNAGAQGAAYGHAQSAQAASAVANARKTEGGAATAASGATGGFVQKSELVGTFYRAASPTSASFTDVGKRVKKGQTLCIVEAMKIMNEIEAEIDGEIAEILVENGKPVEFGTPLFVIKPA